MSVLKLVSPDKSRVKSFRKATENTAPSLFSLIGLLDTFQHPRTGATGKKIVRHGN